MSVRFPFAWLAPALAECETLEPRFGGSSDPLPASVGGCSAGLVTLASGLMADVVSNKVNLVCRPLGGRTDHNKTTQRKSRRRGPLAIALDRGDGWSSVGTSSSLAREVGASEMKAPEPKTFRSEEEREREISQEVKASPQLERFVCPYAFFFCSSLTVISVSRSLSGEKKKRRVYPS